MENNKKIWIVVGGVAIAIVLIIVFTGKKNRDVTVEQPEQSVVVESTEDTTKGSIHAVPPSPAGVPTEEQRLTYQEATEMYTDKRIQFDEQCHATPFQVVYKNGTSIMLDNRSPNARTLNVGGPISIKAWGFKIIKLSSDTFPKALIVDCDTTQNVATIAIEK